MDKINKILIVRFSSIGDIVLTSPVIRCVKTKYPNAEIHFLSKTVFLPVIENNPYLYKCWGINSALNEVLEDLKHEKFDLLIDLHKNLRTLDLKRQLKVKSTTFNKLNLKKWLLTNFKLNVLPQEHIVDRYLDSVKKYGVENDNKGLDFFIDENENIEIKNLIPELNQKFVVLVCGAAHNTKNLTSELSIKLLQKLDFPIVLIGGKAEIDKGDLIVHELKKQNVYNLCGKLSLGESASIIKQSVLVITPDTGMLHIAAALNKKIISIWGNTVPEFGMYPYLPGKESQFKIAEVKNLSCRPCSKIGYEICPKKHFNCINLLDLEQIKNWANEYYNEVL